MWFRGLHLLKSQDDVKNWDLKFKLIATYNKEIRAKCMTKKNQIFLSNCYQRLRSYFWCSISGFLIK